ncbi:MAG: hypothetical protein KatS3mg078_0833 [Deltaproteobacteria bacterium]|nr:MAG: hypothetical protein KatS3mg078_0833 [Deltaproteobacteria bacterium]
MKKSSYVVQGFIIDVFCKNNLNSIISTYFNRLYSGKKRSDAKSLEFEFYITEKPYPIPSGLVRVVKSPLLTYYRKGKEIYFISEDGSTVCLNPTARSAKGFIRRETLNNSLVLYSLIGACLLENLKYLGLYFLHSAALYGNGIGYLVSGDGGCGKTTISISLVREGFKYVSDDSLLLEEIGEEVVVHPLYTNFHIDQNLAECFPEIAGDKCLSIPEGSKVSVDISKIFPDSFIPHLRPDIIITPKITYNEKSQLYPISQLEVYKRLLKQIPLAVDKEVSKNQLNALEKLVKQTTCFELLSGKDIHKDPKRLVSLICEVTTLWEL